MRAGRVVPKEGEPHLPAAAEHVFAVPLEAEEFAGLMAPLAPFEPDPRIAVAVSGGADSLALVVLLHDWASARGGTVSALTVDHGLRPESAAEAGFVARTLAPLGLQHRILRWRDAKPGSNVQAVARRARYDLLLRWGAARGLLHLALGHHLDDQGETLLLRLGRGSGLEGLAAMAPVVELPGLRLLRPLLGVPKARLEATLSARGLAWIEDPSNRDPTQARARLRLLMPRLAKEGLTPARLAATAGHLGRARAALDLAVGRLLVRAVAVHPAGFARLESGPLLAAPEEIGLRALARVLMTVGGAEYTPRLERLQRLYGRIGAGLARGATLGGCRIVRRRGRLLVVRETAAVPEVPVRPGERLRWDGRFEVSVHRRAGDRGGALRLGALGTAGWAEARAAAPDLRATPIPAPARPALPALRDAEGLLAVPYLGYERRDSAGFGLKSCRFRPASGLTALAFAAAQPIGRSPLQLLSLNGALSY
jgi:tRNA(Ile)-lysidine synthase